jgi:hypothetical protein
VRRFAGKVFIPKGERETVSIIHYGAAGELF